MRNAASSPTAVSAPPSLPGQVLRVGQRAGHSLCQVLARGGLGAGDGGLDPPGHAAHVVSALGTHVEGVHAAVAIGERLELVELQVHVRGLAAERCRRHPDHLESLSVQVHTVADPEVLARRVARSQDHLAGAPGREVVALRDLAGRDRAELAVCGVHSAHAAGVEVDVLRRSRGGAAGAGSEPWTWSCSGTVPDTVTRLSVRPPAASRTPSMPRHLGRSRSRERELRARGEVGVGELLTRLAEVAEALAHRAVLALEPAALGIRQAAPEPPAPGRPGA